MTALDIFVFCMTVASIITVIIWGIVAVMVLQGMFELCGDVWRTIRNKA